MIQNRYQDTPSSETPKRSERVFIEHDLWYFRTREGDAVGPFRYRSEAESNLDRFMTQLRERLEPQTVE